MGATSWKYFTPYQEDVRKALQDLRQQEFNAGRYEKNDKFLKAIDQIIKDRNPSVEQVELLRAAYENLNKLKSKNRRPPKTIEQLLKMKKDTGTHSIIDIFEIEKSTDKTISGTVSQEDLVRLFGTDTPNHKMVEDKADELIDFRERGLCTYVVVYDNGVPSELFFAGYSGD